MTPLNQSRISHGLRRVAFFMRHVLTVNARIKNYAVGPFARALGRKEVLGYTPYQLDIEPTTHCNFRCGHCQVSAPGWDAKHLSFDDFKQVIDRNPEVFKIKLQGMGEPFVNRRFLDMAQYAASAGVYVSVITNGSALLQRVRERLIADRSVRELTISLDGAVKETFEAIRTGGDFDRVVANARALVDANQRLPAMRRMFIGAWTVLQERNREEALAIVDLAASIGFDRLTIQLELTDWGSAAWKKNKRKQVKLQAMEVDRLRRRAAERGLWLEVLSAKRMERGTPCEWPFDSLYVSAAMDAVPCCLIANPAVANMGSLRTVSLATLWNGEKFRAMRRDLMAGSIPRHCEQCYVAEARRVAWPLKVEPVVAAVADTVW